MKTKLAILFLLLLMSSCAVGKKYYVKNSCLPYDTRRTEKEFWNIILNSNDPMVQELRISISYEINDALKNSNSEKVRRITITPDRYGMEFVKNNSFMQRTTKPDKRVKSTSRIFGSQLSPFESGRYNPKRYFFFSYEDVERLFADAVRGCTESERVVDGLKINPKNNPSTGRKIWETALVYAPGLLLLLLGY